MPATQIAAQLYTLRDHLKTPADIAASLKRVKQIGYDAIQISGMGPIEPKELNTILDGEGLICAATHTHPLDKLRDQVDSVIANHKLWDCRYTAIGGYFSPDPTMDEWRAFAKDFTAIAAKYAGSGVQIGYHNHSHELASYSGLTALQFLIDELPKEVWFEIDTYWITHGGGDPVQWINKVAGRVPCLHVKDMAITPKREQRMAPIGAGNLNWSAIIPAARAAGVQWFIVEQDDTYDADPFDCLATSLRNLRGMGLK